jgi:hypothetical protein
MISHRVGPGIPPRHCRRRIQPTGANPSFYLGRHLSHTLWHNRVET